MSTSWSESQPGPIEPQKPETSPWATPTADLDYSGPAPPTVSPGLWGPWATIGWTILCILVGFVAQLAVVVGNVLVRTLISGSDKIDDLALDGNVLALATLCSTISTIGLVALPRLVA